MRAVTFYETKEHPLPLGREVFCVVLSPYDVRIVQSATFCQWAYNKKSGEEVMPEDGEYVFSPEDVAELEADGFTVGVVEEENRAEASQVLFWAHLVEDLDLENY